MPSFYQIYEKSLYICLFSLYHHFILILVHSYFDDLLFDRSLNISLFHVLYYFLFIASFLRLISQIEGDITVAKKKIIKTDFFNELISKYDHR